MKLSHYQMFIFQLIVLFRVFHSVCEDRVVYIKTYTLLSTHNLINEKGRSFLTVLFPYHQLRIESVEYLNQCVYLRNPLPKSVKNYKKTDIISI